MMNYMQLIYNPMAGTRLFKNHLDRFLEVVESMGYELRIHRTMKEEDFSELFSQRDFSECKAIFIAGGDGSVNHTINALFANDIHCPIGVIPAGTANDYAKHIGMQDSFPDTFDILSKEYVRNLDLGIVNGKYFVNVCCGGLLMDVSHKVEQEWKNLLGKLAYYIKGVQELPNFRPIPFRITTPEGVYEQELYMFLVLNGKSAGGFNKIGGRASMEDGKLDFVGIKNCPINEIPFVFAKIVRGEHITDKNILYLETTEITIECLDETEVPSDVDGEPGPAYPLHIEVAPKALPVYVNPENVTLKE